MSTPWLPIPVVDPDAVEALAAILQVAPGSLPMLDATAILQTLRAEGWVLVRATIEP